MSAIGVAALVAIFLSLCSVSHIFVFVFVIKTQKMIMSAAMILPGATLLATISQRSIVEGASTAVGALTSHALRCAGNTYQGRGRLGNSGGDEFWELGGRHIRTVVASMGWDCFHALLGTSFPIIGVSGVLIFVCLFVCLFVCFFACVALLWPIR
jgi:hypothetical protein